jgi:hypothetical protein
VLAHIIETARRRGYELLSHETGSQPAFVPGADALLAAFGFDVCGPFADYRDDRTASHEPHPREIGRPAAIQPFVPAPYSPSIPRARCRRFVTRMGQRAPPRSASARRCGR